MTRYFVPGAALVALVGVAFLWPRNGDAGAEKPRLTLVYSGDVVGKIEPCG